jgi:hypothetical protein
VRDALNDDLSIVPDSAGAYILGASDGTKFIYPWGNSPVFYIGQSIRLSKRVLTHIKYIQLAMDNHDDYWRPRYQYGASYGVTVAWYRVRGLQNPNRLEADLVNSFYDVYGSIPVSNSSWPNG